MIDINCIERILDKRCDKGATDTNLIAWLEHLKLTSWRNRTKEIEDFINAIKQASR